MTEEEQWLPPSRVVAQRTGTNIDFGFASTPRLASRTKTFQVIYIPHKSLSSNSPRVYNTSA